MTEKLYDNDSYLVEFDCKVVSLYSDEKYIYVKTDRTAFFPEGGGQTSDVGYLGDIYVENVQIIEGEILHFVENCEENVEKLKDLPTLQGKIDMKKRFSDMQQHTGEHIFSGIVHSLYGYNNVGFHLGTEIVTLDFDGVLEDDDICKVETLVNKAVWDNIEIKILFPVKQELSFIEYRSKKEIEGQVRIVEIPGIDICACCAPHVKRTGEIGIVRVVNFEHYKGGTRVSILCGERALLDIRHKLKQNKLVSVLTCSKQNETASAVERLKDENERLKYENVGLTRELLSLKATALEQSDTVFVFDERLEGKLLLDFAVAASEKAGEITACFCPAGESVRYCILSKSKNLVPFAKLLNSAFNGRGGGKTNIIQGSIQGSREEIEEFVRIGNFGIS